MAKKKLNKKVAVIVSVFLVLFAVAGIWVLSRKLQGPQKFIEDGDAAVAAKDYVTAIKQYGRAFGKAKDNETRKKVLFKLADTHILNDAWRNALGCWSKISTIDTSDIVSRTKMLNFYYDVASNGQSSVWKNVLTTVDEILPLAPEAKFYLIKGRAKLEIAKSGEVTDRVAALNETIEILKKAKDLDAKNPDVYRYLADAFLEKGERLAAQGSVSEKDKAQKDAQKLLERAIAVAPNDPNAYMQLLNMKLLAAQDTKQIDALESDYIGLTKKFPQNPDIFMGLSYYYKRNPSEIDKAVKAAQKAVELSPQSAKYAINAADTYYRKGTLEKDNQSILKAIEIAGRGLSLPDAQDTHSAREYVNRMNKLSLNTFLAQRYTEQILALPAGSQSQLKDALIAKDANAVHQIAQIWGSGEYPYVAAVEGMLDYAKGNTTDGIRKMYTAYTQLTQSDPDFQDAQLGQLSYMLAEIFLNSPEIGVTREFLYNALQRKIFFTKPDSLLIYARISTQLGLYSDANSAVVIYEKLFKPTDVSRLLRANANIGIGQFDEAQSLLAKINKDDPNAVAARISLLQKRIDQAMAASIDANEAKKESKAIQAEIEKYRGEQLKFAQKLLLSEPNAGDALTMICENYITQNKIKEAKVIVENVLARSPQNSTAGFYKLLLAEPDPAKSAKSQTRREELSSQVAMSIPDPATRAMLFGDYYRTKEKYDNAITEYKKVLQVQPSNTKAINGLFETALLAKDYKLAEQMVSAAKRENADLCHGQVFAARLSIAKKDYNDALNRLDAAMKERPIFSVGNMLRSSVYAELGKEQLAIEEARKAMQVNPLDGLAAKNFANLLYQRNIKLGPKVSAEQKVEAQAAIEHAWRLNPQEWKLLRFYAEYISSTEPSRALAIYQRIQSMIPSAQNAALAGNMAVKMASTQKDPEQAKALLAIAASAYEQGYKIDPNDTDLLKGYANYYTVIGKPEMATKLLSKTSNKNLLWVHQIQTGQFEQAKAALDKLYKENPKDANVLKGLTLTSQSLNDAKGVEKYSQELLSFENTQDNQFAQIKSYLQVNLVEQSQKLLASFKEKYPNDNRTLSVEALLATKKGQFSDAIALLNKELELKPDDFAAWHMRGQVHFARGNYEEAVTDFKKAKEIAPTMQTRVDLARAYLRAGRGDDAINELVLAAESEPGNPSIYSLLEQTYIQLGKTDALSRFYKNVIQANSNNPYWYNRAALLATSQKDFDTAASLSKTAMELSQKSDAAMPKEAALQQSRIAIDNYLEVMRQKKQYDQLITYASQYIDSDLAYVAFVQMADAKAELGDKAKAFEYYNKALMKASSEDIVVLNILRKMNAVIGRDETVRWCTDQLKITPDSLPINMAMCNLLRMNKENTKALPYIDKCLQLTKANSSSYQTFFETKQAILSDLYNSTSDEKYLNDAIKLYESYTSDSPSIKATNLNNMAYLLVSNDRDIDKAVAYAQKACDIIQNNPDLLDTYAYTLYKKGDYTKAFEVINNAVQMFERTNVSAPADVYEHVGMINAKLGRKTEAVNAYKQALKIGEKTLADQQKQRIKTAMDAIK